MLDVRTRNSGTFDRTTSTWRIKGRNIQISTRQLSRRYNVDLRKGDKRGSLPYWRRYLQELDELDYQASRSSSPLPQRIKSIERIIEQFKAEGRPTGLLEVALRDAVNVPHWDIEEADHQILHPDIEERLAPSGLVHGLNELEIGLLNNERNELLNGLLPSKSVEKSGSGTVGSEAVAFVRRQKDRYRAEKCLDILKSITGDDLPIENINVDHFRQYLDRINAVEEWKSPTTRYKASILIRTFLKSVQSDYNANFGFLDNPAYRIAQPEGRKVQYTSAQLKIALDNARGRVRFALLCGLNFGAYWGDITSLRPEHIQGEYLVKARQKNKHRSNLQGHWKLWDATRDCLEFGLSRGQVEKPFAKFQKQFSLPPHKALRSTVTQIIQDEVSEEASRLYRCEGVGGTHGKFYVRNFTPQQVELLDTALTHVANKLNIT